MSGCRQRWLSGALVFWMACAMASGQVFVVGEKTGTADLTTHYSPPAPLDMGDRPPLDELGRRSLIRAFEAEQGFARLALPLGTVLTLKANGELKPGDEAYRAAIYQKGTAAAPGQRVAITKFTVKGDELIFDLNGGPYLPHRFLRHVEINDNNVVNPGSADQPTGARLTLVFSKFVPDLSPDEVKRLISGVIDFNSKSGKIAYTDTLPPKIREAVKAHEALVGMDRDMVVAAMGEPQNKVRETGPDGRRYEDWIYGKAPQTIRFVRFAGDRVVRIEVAARGEPIVVRTKNETGDEVAASNTREIAAGDGQPNNPPTLRKPGDPELPGGMQQVQFPKDGSGKGSGAPAQGSVPPSMHTVEFPNAKPVGDGQDGSHPDASAKLR